MKNIKKISLLVILIFASKVLLAQLSLDSCQIKARNNYPAIKKYGLIEKTNEFTISNISKSYLPQFYTNVDYTYVSTVPEFPDKMKSMFAATGLKMSGISNDQYKLAVGLSQNIWDGGISSAKLKIANADNEISIKNLELELYSIKNRVNSLFFGILLVNENLKINKLSQKLISSNLQKLKDLYKNGVALKSNLESLEVELLSIKQKEIEILAKKKSLLHILSVFIGDETILNQELIKPSKDYHITHNIMRPELDVFNAMNKKLEAQETMIKASTNPKLFAFAQGVFGKPGLNIFESMIDNDWALDYMFGIKLQWNIGNLYTKRNSINKLNISKRIVENTRETFLFNLNIKKSEEEIQIDKMKEIILSDDEIINKRVSIRKASESKLENGIIDINDLLHDITQESHARLSKSMHEILLLRNIHQLKNTLNIK
ncbi:TolC family protein [Marinilabiliaceae bacterium JC040]|nr:TolC family protein [Marinilabiliaceae bacterium JC040]